MTLQGDGVQTHIVCSYNPCRNGKLNSGTSYQRHCQYFIMHKKDLSCPRKQFRKDLIKQLEEWRQDRDRLIVCLDINKDIYNKLIGKALMNDNGLNMSKEVGDFTGKHIGATFFCGSKPIDGVWATQVIIITHACVMLAGFGIGDHWMFVIDVQEETILRTAPFRVKRFALCRLNTKVSNGATQKYLTKLEEGLSRHRLIEKINKLHMQYKSEKKLQNELNKLDRQSKDMMINAERKCRWIKSGRIPFSPESALWIQRTQVYKSLFRHLHGLIWNVGNLKRTARKCSIQ
jgi:hypothetical protein